MGGQVHRPEDEAGPEVHALRREAGGHPDAVAVSGDVLRLPACRCTSGRAGSPTWSWSASSTTRSCWTGSQRRRVAHLEETKAEAHAGDDTHHAVWVPAGGRGQARLPLHQVSDAGRLTDEVRRPVSREGGSAMSMTHVVGVDPGLVHTGVVEPVVPDPCPPGRGSGIR